MPNSLVLHYNAGTTSVTNKGDLKGFATVWYHLDGSINILSLNNVNIGTVKKGARSTTDSLPFKRYPPSLITQMVYNFVFWLNSFPDQVVIHATISPRTSITRLPIDYYRHCKVGFRTYVQVHKAGDFSLRLRTSSALA